MGKSVGSDVGTGVGFVGMAEGTTVGILVVGTGVGLADVGLADGSYLAPLNGPGASYGACAGGGTDLRTKYGGTDGSENLDSRLVVAGGSGGGTFGGDGGGLVGQSGRYVYSSLVGQGGTQTAGGAGSERCSNSLGSLWKGGSCWKGPSSGGGGGGYFGGGAGYMGGGGGSSYVISTGVVLENVRGDPRCSDKGSLYITVQSALPAAPLPVQSPTPVPPGSYSSCEAGTFLSGLNSDSCSGCPAGTYRKVGDNPRLCKACDPGFYSAPFASSCLPCSAGHYSNSGAATCIICPSGTFSFPSSMSCTPCELGSFSAPGSSVCSSCDS